VDALVNRKERSLIGSIDWGGPIDRAIGKGELGKAGVVRARSPIQPWRHCRQHAPTLKASKRIVRVANCSLVDHAMQKRVKSIQLLWVLFDLTITRTTSSVTLVSRQRVTVVEECAPTIVSILAIESTFNWSVAQEFVVCATVAVYSVVGGPHLSLCGKLCVTNHVERSTAWTSVDQSAQTEKVRKKWLCTSTDSIEWIEKQTNCSKKSLEVYGRGKRRFKFCFRLVRQLTLVAQFVSTCRFTSSSYRKSMDFFICFHS
jgi:hypothetical protein